MNRRIFLKSLATACGVAVVCPGELVKNKPTPKIGVGERSKHIVMGVTNEQLCELIRATLKELPKTTFTVMDEFETERDHLYFNGVRVFYRSPLYDETA